MGEHNSPTEQAALLIYLNKTCYNGLYRVNRSGKFNVPLGKYANPTFLDADNLRACSMVLQEQRIAERIFHECPLIKGDFYYLDPPYHQTYSSYDGSGFGDAEHRQLAEFCQQIDAAGGYFMLSNSDTELIRELYARYADYTEVISAGAIYLVMVIAVDAKMNC